MAEPMRARRGKALATATIEALDGFVDLAAALDEARRKYRRDLVVKRPPNSFTVKEFVADYNRRAKQEGTPQIGKRTAEETLARWARLGEYHRAPMMIAEVDGKARRTYVYWKAKQ